MKSSNIIVNKEWKVIKPFHILVPGLDHTTNAFSKESWNVDWNFPDYENYMIVLYERKWALAYIKGLYDWNIFYGLRGKDILEFDGMYHGFPDHKEEVGAWKTGIKGYKMGELINGERCLSVLLP